MATEKTKRVVIKKADLPAYSGEHQSYIVRYRIISEDKNRSSHWSPQYLLPVSSATPASSGLSINPSANMINLVWESDESSSNKFDIYVKWDSDPYVYAGSVATTMYACLIKSGASTVKFAVQVPTFPKQRFDSATIFETQSASVVV